MIKLFHFVLIVSGMVFSSSTFAATVCLNMIVKDEAHVIARALQSAKPYIDYWVIVDTGSTDETCTIIEQEMQGIPGELHRSKWCNFETNRNAAFQLAKNKADYLLFLDADDYYEYGDKLSWESLSMDCYYVPIRHGGTTYYRPQLIKTSIEWEWKGVVHEYIMANQPHSTGYLQNMHLIHTGEGNRSRDSRKYACDAELLESALAQEPGNTRYVFYLAQSYRDAGQLENALQHYQKRSAMGGWDQEVYWSLLQIARLKERLHYSPMEIIEAYRKAHDYRPSRVEPLYSLVRYLNHEGDFFNAYSIASQALNLSPSNDVLFTEHWIEDHGMLLEFSVSAYWIGEYREAFLASMVLMSKPHLDQSTKKLVLRNLEWIQKALD